MAAANILAIGTTQASSSDVVVASGASLTVFLKGASGVVPDGATIAIMLKDDLGAYEQVGSLVAGNLVGGVATTDRFGRTALLIAAPGTYRFDRAALAVGAVGFGVASA